MKPKGFIYVCNIYINHTNTQHLIKRYNTMKGGKYIVNDILAIKNITFISQLTHLCHTNNVRIMKRL